MTSKHQSKCASKMSKEDEDDGGPDDLAVQLLVRAVKKPEVADEKSNLEEADAHLVNGPSCVIDPGEGYEILLWTKYQR